MIRFSFKERKAAQAAAYLLKAHNGTLNYMKLLKLLYLADRKSLIETGAPVTGDKIVSMPHGPVLSRILNFINWGKEGPQSWYEYISEPKNKKVSLNISQPGYDELSKYEIQVLEEINTRFGQLNQWQLRDLTHDLPEWEDPQGSSFPIHPEKILEVANIPPEQIQRITERAEESRFFDTLS